MFIFNLLDRNIQISENIKNFTDTMIRPVDTIPSTDINETEIFVSSPTRQIDTAIFRSELDNNEINQIIDKINNSNETQLSIINNTGNKHLKIINSIKMIYQFNELLTYSGQSFKSHNGVKIPFISKERIGDNDFILFNTMIPSTESINNVLIYKTELINGRFVNTTVPFIINNGYYKIQLKIRKEKIEEESDDSQDTYRIIDDNGYVTCISFI